MLQLQWRGWRWLWAVGPLLIGGCGCYELGYSTSVAIGELNFLVSAVPIEEALDDPALTDEQREKLALAIRARDYAEQVIGLNVGTSYRTFVNLNGKPLAWNLSASRKDAVEAYYWDVPFVGPIPYLGYFEFDQAVAERDWLVAQGYDTLIYEIEAYSTIGLLPDPMTSSLLKNDATRFIDTIIHELLHNTVWSGWNTVFDESLAVFVARTGAMEFLTSEFGPEDPLVQQARENYADTELFNAFLDQLRAELDELYGRDLSRDEKIEARQPIFEAARQRVADELLPAMNNPATYETYATFDFNNAFMLVNERYHTDFDLFANVYELAGRNWATALDLFRQAAESEDPFAFLRNLLTEDAAGMEN